jgi:antitoxin HigA-1
MKTKTKSPDKLANPHPGMLLKKYFLEPLGLSQAQLSLATGLANSRLSELLRGRRGITVDSAIRLAKVLGPTPQFWLGLQADFDMEEAMYKRRSEYEALRPWPKSKRAA